MKKVAVLSKLKRSQIEETLKDFKCLLTRYNEVRDNDILSYRFCSRNRSQLWDLTTVNYFKTGLKSQKLIESNGNKVDDHYIQRVKSTKIIFELLRENPDLSVDEFIILVKRYVSTVLLAKDEHMKITTYVKKTDKMNYMAYEEVGIVIPGLKEYVIENQL
jgi:hypothetical protein